MARGGSRRGRELDGTGYGLTLEELPRPVTSRSLFGNDAPLELEVGSGKGTLLVRESEIRPDSNFVGVEYSRPYWRLAGDRLRRNACDNARVVLAEAATFLRDFIDDESLSAVHVYFPDPWPKTRHHRRRFVQSDRLELLARKMRPRARLQIVTDHEDYSRQIESVVQSSPLVAVIAFDTTAGAAPDEIVGSNFERKYRREGRAFYAIAATRV